MSNYDYNEALEAVEYIKKNLNINSDSIPLTAIVTGSGLGELAEIIENPKILDVKNINNWPISTAPGHAGKIFYGRISGRNIILLQGRVHYYEGYNLKAVTFPVRVLAMLGVREYLAVNASGAINENFKPGQIISVEDHINFIGDNPLIGQNENRWNERFPDMTHTYSRKLLKIAEKLNLQRGVYIAFSGPSYETPAEIKMAKILGADLVGMSTVPEVITANSMGLEVAVLSCVANMAAGISGNKLTGEEVLNQMHESIKDLKEIILKFIREL